MLFYRCAQNKIKQDEHDRILERNRQEEEMRAAQHRREMEADQQRHRQELKQKEHQKMLEIKERAQADIEKQSNARLEHDKRMQDETERDFQRKYELQMAEVKMKVETAEAEAEARKAEAKAKEANSTARVAEANAKSAEAEAKTAEANLKIANAKAKEKELEHRSMLWKKYFNPETNIQDKEFIAEEIKRLSTSGDQNVKKVLKEIKAPKSKGDLLEIRSRHPWTVATSRF